MLPISEVTNSRVSCGLIYHKSYTQIPPDPHLLRILLDKDIGKTLFWKQWKSVHLFFFSSSVLKYFLRLFSLNCFLFLVIFCIIKVIIITGRVPLPSLTPVFFAYRLSIFFALPSMAFTPQSCEDLGGYIEPT